MKIVFIGAGNLATNLALEISQSEHQIVQVFSRTRESASLLAEKVNCEPVNEMSKVVCDADLYIVSVKDDALEMLIPELCKGREDKMFVHTAGSMPMDVFKDYARHYGVFYPMQTFTKDKKVAFENIPIFIEGCGAFETSFLKRLAEQISRSVYELDSDNRKYLHLSAVFACNFANHCVAIGQQILEIIIFLAVFSVLWLWKLWTRLLRIRQLKCRRDRQFVMIEM